MLFFQTSQPLLYIVVVALPPSVERLSPIEQDKILSDQNYFPQIAPFMELKIHKTN